MITTLYDKRYNESDRKSCKHGSCGVGFGATIERNENNYKLTYADIFYPKIFELKLDGIRDYYIDKIIINNYADNGIGNLLLWDVEEFLDSCDYVRRHVKLVYGLPNRARYIFEGAQGLLLDQNYGFFPNVTRSNTGTKNALTLRKDLDVYLVTRAYQTRHGNGFMTNEELSNGYIKVDSNETNVEHRYQGKFRRSMLDLDLLEYAINKDDYVREAKDKKLVITCLDHLDSYRFTYKGNIYGYSDINRFLVSIADILHIKHIFYSGSPDNEFNCITFK